MLEIAAFVWLMTTHPFVLITILVIIGLMSMGGKSKPKAVELETVDIRAGVSTKHVVLGLACALVIPVILIVVEVV